MFDAAIELVLWVICSIVCGRFDALKVVCGWSGFISIFYCGC